MSRVQAYFGNNAVFITVMSALILIAAFVFNNPTLAMWFGFGVAAFSTISNDSIQTLGTFLSSNSKTSWKKLWLFIGGIMIVTLAYGWLTHGGDVSYDRLSRIPQPADFTFIQLLAPIILIALTRYRMPVSTTFLILATFSSSKTIGAMINKTLIGYIVSFLVAILVWTVVGYIIKKRREKAERNLTKIQERNWRILQWGSTGFLWTAWLTQDAANSTVFLPRIVNFNQLIIILLIMFLMIGYILYKRGGEIQKVVTEKTDVLYVKSATVIDFVYGSILIYFKWINSIPMSTTWVFLGMLAGREIALRFSLNKDQPYSKTLRLVQKDLLRAGFGLGISLALAFMINEKLDIGALLLSKIF